MEKFINDLPVFYINFDEEQFESGIDKIALTEDPAIEVMSMRFKNDKRQSFKIEEEKHIIVGPAIIPDKPIYRRDGNIEYYVVFTKNVIEQMVEKFNSEQREIKFNLEHNNKNEIKGFIKESWIVEDKKFDKSNLYGFDVPVGTWMISAKITDENTWDNVVKNMEQVGFSIEGLMGVQLEEFKNKNKVNNMSKKIKKNKYFSNLVINKRKFNKTKRKFENEVVVSDEMEVLIAPELEEGVEVETITDEGILAPAEDGTYLIPEEGVEIEIEDGAIISVEEVETTEDVEETFESEDEIETIVEEVIEDKIDEIVEEVIEEVENNEGETEDFEDETNEDELVDKIAELETRIEEIEKEKKEDEEEKEEFNKKRNFSTIQSLIYFNKSNFRK